MAQEPDMNEVLKRLEAVEQKLGIVYIPHAETKIEGLIEKVEPRTLDFILRNVDAKDLVLAMVGFKGPALLKIKAALTHKSWNMLRDDFQYHLRQGVSESSAREARRKVMGIIQQTAGEIPGYPPPEWESLRPEDWSKKEELLETFFKTQENLDAWKKNVLDELEKN